MKDALKIVDSRKDKWMPASWQTDKRFGAMSKEEWEARLRATLGVDSTLVK